MTGEHQKRCETCKHREVVHNHGMGTHRPRCKITKWFLDACAPTTIEHDFIDKLGCASHSSASGPMPERIGSIRQTVLQEDAYLIERVNAGMGEWEYIIQYCGEYYATAPTEEIARSIVELAQHTCPILSPVHDEQIRQEARAEVLDELQAFIDNPDSREGCGFGMMSLDALVNRVSFL